MKLSQSISLVSTSLLCLVASAAEATARLESDVRVAVKGKAQKFDFMASDSARHRILAAHKGARTLEVLDAQSGNIIRSVPVGEVQGVAVDVKGNRYFAGNAKEQTLEIVDAGSFKKLGEVKVDAPIDAVTFDSKSGMVYAAADDGDHLWAIDPISKKVTGTVMIPGIPEFMEFNESDNKIYLNIKDRDQIVKINPDTNEVEQTMSTSPVTSPHGLAVDANRGLVYVAGKNSKLVAVDFVNKKIVSTVDVPIGNDQLIFDPSRDLIFGACKDKISVTKATDQGLEDSGESDSPVDAHTIAFDKASASVWIVYADQKGSYFQKYQLK